MTSIPNDSAEDHPVDADSGFSHPDLHPASSLDDSTTSSNSTVLLSSIPSPSNALPDTASNRDDIWGVALIVVASLATYLVASVVAIVVAAFAVHDHLKIEQFRDANFVNSLTQSRVGFPIIVILPQFAMIVPVAFAASLSPVGFRKRLRLVRGRWPGWMSCCAAMATPLIGMISSVIVGMFLKESESLLEMTRVFRELADDGFVIPLAVMIGATPGVCEELLFRGYIQSRLTVRWGGLVGILVSSAVFAAFHMDLVHSTAVFSLGLWLGWIVWHSGSLFPAIIAHFVNNFLSVLAVSYGPEPGSDEVNLVAGLMMLGVFFLGTAAFTTTIVAAKRLRGVTVVG